jgi:hypothetical protein
MPSHRTMNTKRASAAARDTAAAHDGAAVHDSGTTTGRTEQRLAIEQAMAQQNVRQSRSPGAVGPIGRALLLIALLTLVGLIAVWVLLVL